MQKKYNPSSENKTIFIFSNIYYCQELYGSRMLFFVFFRKPRGIRKIRSLFWDTERLFQFQVPKLFILELISKERVLRVISFYDNWNSCICPTEKNRKSARTPQKQEANIKIRFCRLPFIQWYFNCSHSTSLILKLACFILFFQNSQFCASWSAIILISSSSAYWPFFLFKNCL